MAVLEKEKTSNIGKLQTLFDSDRSWVVAQW